MPDTGLISAKDILAEELQDPEFRSLWEEHAPARALALRLVEYRADHGLTQTQLARMLGMKQPAIARLEAGEHTPTIPTLLRIAEALDIEFLINIRPTTTRRRRSWVSAYADRARVVERVTTPSGSELLVAAG